MCYSFTMRMMVRPRLVSYTYQNDCSIGERSPAISRLVTASSKVPLPLLKSKMLPILRGAAGFCSEKQSKLGFALPVQIGEHSFEIISGKKLPSLLNRGGLFLM